MSVMMKGLTLKQVELARLTILNRVLEKQMTEEEASRILGLSERHTWRMLGAYRKEIISMHQICGRERYGIINRIKALR